MKMIIIVCNRTESSLIILNGDAGTGAFRWNGHLGKIIMIILIIWEDYDDFFLLFGDDYDDDDPT